MVNDTAILWIIGAVAFFFIAKSIFVIVPGKRAAILETFGKPHKNALTPGLNLKLPWPITQVVGEINLQLMEIGENVSVKTKDNAFMTLPVKVQFRADGEPSGAVKAHYELENPEVQIASYVLNNVRQTASGMLMVDLYQNRDSIESQVQQTLQERFIKFGFIIENVLVDEPQPSAEVRDSFNRVIASEREKEAATNLAEAERIKLVGIARAEAESKKLQGEGIANMREAIAKGMDKAMQTLKSAGISEEQALALLIDVTRFDTIDNAAHHGNLVLVDTQSSSTLLDTIAAVKAATQK